MTGPQSKVQEYAGSFFLDLLSDPAFCRQWDSLYAACPWATAFQSRAFAAIWYSTYASVFEPLLICARDATGDLSGLLALARDRKTRDLVHVGAHQAEYHAWLSTVDDGDLFIEAALDHLAGQFPGARLRLSCLPPGAPVGWLEPSRPWAGRTRLRSVQRPVMALGTGDNFEESLLTEGNQSRIDRLRQLLGPVRIEVLHSRKEIEPVFDRIVDFCDFCYGAHRQCLPFRDDPLKREFYLRLVDSPELAHASVLRAGDEIVAAHIGARNGASVQLGLIAQSPFYSEHSPGELLLQLLGRKLGSEGFESLDFTPDGKDKDPLATHCDTAHAGYVFFRKRDAHLHDFRSKVADGVKARLSRVSVTPGTRRWYAQALRAVRINKPPVLALKLVRWIARRTWSEAGMIFYDISPEDAARMEKDPRLSRDSLADLLLYEQARPADRTKHEFLCDAFARLASGGHVYTAAGGKRLMHYAWLSPVAGPVPTELGSKFDHPPGSMTLWDDYTHPASRGMGLHQASIRSRLRDASTMVKGGGIFISVLANNGPSRHNIERAGFRRCATVVRRFRFGKTTWEWNFEH